MGTGIAPKLLNLRSGKSWERAMGYALALAPTGTAASLTRDKKTVRAFRIPVGKKAADVPTNLAD
jgi:hypothetical protein